MRIKPSLLSASPRLRTLRDRFVPHLFLLLLTVPACDEGTGRHAFTTPAATERIILENPDRYRDAGVYTDLRDAHGIYLYNNGHKMLVALDATNPATGCGVLYQPVSGIYQDPCDGTLFTPDGLVQRASSTHLDTQPLARFELYETGTRANPAKALTINPANRYHFRDARDPRSASSDPYHWSNPKSGHLFE